MVHICTLTEEGDATLTRTVCRGIVTVTLETDVSLPGFSDPDICALAVGFNATLAKVLLSWSVGTHGRD